MVAKSKSKSDIPYKDGKKKRLKKCKELNLTHGPRRALLAAVRRLQQTG